MMDSNRLEKIEKVFVNYCQEKGYQIKIKKIEHGVQIEVSNVNMVSKINIYKTGKITTSGQENSLKVELNEYIKSFEENPSQYVESAENENKHHSVIYKIIIEKLQKEIKDYLVSEFKNCQEEKGLKVKDIIFRLKINNNEYHLAITQYNNGTLLLQGKSSFLFEDVCDQIEKIAKPDEKDVVSRFISKDEKVLEEFVKKYTPQLITDSEMQLKSKIGNAFDYLEDYDKKWIVAALVLCYCEIPFPEFSPIVMPASKALEGFAKKVLTDLQMVEKEYFKDKKANFSILKDFNNPKRKIISEANNGYNETYLKKLDLSLDMYRNFYLHSNEADITKVSNLEEAKEKVTDIIKNIKEIFEYFSPQYNLLARKQ